jgi:hypothetical protein
MCPKSKKNEKPITLEQIESLIDKKKFNEGYLVKGTAGDRGLCPVHEVIIERYEKDNAEVREGMRDLNTKFDQAYKFVVGTIIKVLISSVLLLAGTVVSLIVFVVLPILNALKFFIAKP